VTTVANGARGSAERHVAVDERRRTLPAVAVRTVVAVVILVLLARVARVAWRQRALSVALWRAVTWRHLAGALLLFIVVAGTATTLLVTVPQTGFGLGSFVGTEGNAVFAPLEEGLARTAPAPPVGPDWALIVGATLFLVPLALLLPWLAYVEEEVFRAGLEDASWPRVVLASVAFGLVHLVMLVPVAAALAIGLAGFAYALIYRRAHRRRPTTPIVALWTFRATRWSAAAADRARQPAPPWTAPASGPPGPGSPPSTDRGPERAQATGVFHAAVWHTTFNSLVVVAVWVSLVATGLT
jgi:membrane protease YdiL (CAAX protease family)